MENVINTNGFLTLDFSGFVPPKKEDAIRVAKEYFESEDFGKMFKKHPEAYKMDLCEIEEIKDEGKEEEPGESSLILGWSMGTCFYFHCSTDWDNWIDEDQAIDEVDYLYKDITKGLKDYLEKNLDLSRCYTNIDFWEDIDIEIEGEWKTPRDAKEEAEWEYQDI